MIDSHDNSEQSCAVLAGLNTAKSCDQYMASMRELKELARSLGLKVVSQIVQNAPSETRKTYHSVNHYLLPYTEGSLLHEVQDYHPGLALDYLPEGIGFTLRPNDQLYALLSPYIVTDKDAPVPNTDAGECKL